MYSANTFPDICQLWDKILGTERNSRRIKMRFRLVWALREDLWWRWRGRRRVQADAGDDVEILKKRSTEVNVHPVETVSHARSRLFFGPFLGKMKEKTKGGVGVLHRSVVRAMRKAKEKIGKVKAFAKAKFGLSQQPSAFAQAKKERLVHELCDLEALVRLTEEGAAMRALHFVEECLKKRKSEADRWWAARERELRWGKAVKAAEDKWIREFSEKIWENLQRHILTDGVQMVIRHQKELVLLERRKKRVLESLQRFVRKMKLRKRLAIWTKHVLRKTLIPRVFLDHGERQIAAVRIQCSFRILAAKRVFLLECIVYEGSLLVEGRQEVLEKWRSRLKNALRAMQRFETDAHRQIRRRIWARTSFSKELAEKHAQFFEERKPCTEIYAVPCDGSVAVRLPSVSFGHLKNAIRENTAAAHRLHWIGVPVGVSRNSEAMTQEYKLIYKPIPAELLGVNLKDSRARRIAAEKLKSLRSDASKKNPHSICPEIADWYEQERQALWNS